jgi:hypothetical protein
MIGIRFCPVSATRARGIVAGRAKGRIAFEGSEHGADLFAFNLVLSEKMIGIRFCPVSATRARGIVAGRAKGGNWIPRAGPRNLEVTQ